MISNSSLSASRAASRLSATALSPDAAGSVLTASVFSVLEDIPLEVSDSSDSVPAGSETVPEALGPLSSRRFSAVRAEFSLEFFSAFSTVHTFSPYNINFLPQFKQVTRTFFAPILPAANPSGPTKAAPTTAFPIPNPFLLPDREVEPHLGH